MGHAGGGETLYRKFQSNQPAPCLHAWQQVSQVPVPQDDPDQKNLNTQSMHKCTTRNASDNVRSIAPSPTTEPNTNPSYNPSSSSIIKHAPDEVRPDRPARWLAEALLTGVMTSDSMPVRGL